MMAAAVQIAGTLAATGHRDARGNHGCWWATSCRVPSHLGTAAVVLLALGPLALLVRRVHPSGVLLFVFSVTVAYVALGYVQGPCYASLLVAVVTAVMHGRRDLAGVVLLAGWGLFLWLPAALGDAGAPTLMAAVTVAAWMLVVLAGSEQLRGRRERAVQARQGRRDEARRRADEERLRIARELHDVLAHNISLINVQSGVALHLIDEQPEQARIALAAINQASADALREVRSVLSVMRGRDEPPPRSPTPGLGRLDELVANASAAGIDVTLQIDGEERPLPASVELAAFRIVQESLTNVVRHAEAGSAEVRLEYGATELTVQVDDDGAGRGTPESGGTGSGIAGMRERAVALGGVLDAGLLPSGGVRVRARLPLEGATAPLPEAR